MRSKHHGGFLGGNGAQHLCNGRGREGLLGTGLQAPRFQHRARRWDATHVKNLRPTVTEPTVAQHQHWFVGGELAGHGLHAKGATARDQHRTVGVVDLLDQA